MLGGDKPLFRKGRDRGMCGEYPHSLDAKGRVNFPAKLRAELGERFIVTRGLDNCLSVYSEAQWEIIEAKLNALPYSKGRKIQRFFFASAVEVEPDKQGRIVIPQNLRDYARLTKDVIIIGASSRAEIWDKDLYEMSREEFEGDPEAMAQSMDELNF